LEVVHLLVHLAPYIKGANGYEALVTVPPLTDSGMPVVHARRRRSGAVGPVARLPAATIPDGLDRLGWCPDAVDRVEAGALNTPTPVAANGVPESAVRAAWCYISGWPDREGQTMDDVSERFLGALSALEHVADEVTSEEAAATLDDAALRLFWREWPQLGSWAGTLWRELNEDLAGPSSAVGEPELDEVGGEGG
jgi:hypothetical protein